MDGRCELRGPTRGLPGSLATSRRRREQGAARIFVVRHGESLWNRTKRVSGQLDPPLSPEGRALALRLREVLREVPLAAIYTSTLRRTIETAQPLARLRGLEVQPRAALCEQHHGVLQGRFRDRRDPEAAELWRRRKADMLTSRIPGGETFSELASRVVPWLRELLAGAAERPVLIVGHRNTNRALLAELLGRPLAVAVEWRLRSKHLYALAPAPRAVVHTISLRARNAGDVREGFWT